MASANLRNITVEYRFAWWVRCYFAALALFARTMGLKPDPDAAVRMAMRGVSWRILNAGPLKGRWRKL